MKKWQSESDALALLLRQKRVLGMSHALSAKQIASVQVFAQGLIEREKLAPLRALGLRLLPLFVSSILLLLNLCVFIPSLAQGFGNTAALLIGGLLQGWLSYSFLIYVLHEGSGHENIAREFGRPAQKFFAALPRLFFVDPDFYRLNHEFHHRDTGALPDPTNTHIVHPWRLLKSLLPGAGLVFKNDFQVFSPDSFRKGDGRRFLIGGAALLAQLGWLALVLGWARGLFMLLVIVPWVIMACDRLRHTYEHVFMNPDARMGTRELGFGPVALILAGGPWGPTCQMAHHLAPQLSWYQQVALHSFLKRELTPAQRAYYGFGKSSVIRVLIQNVFASLKLILLAKKSKGNLERLQIQKCRERAEKFMALQGIRIVVKKWSELTEAELAGLRQLRIQEYSKDCAYLLNDAVETNLRDDASATHFLAFRGDAFLAAARMNESTNAAEEMQLVPSSLKSSTGELGYISRLVRDRDNPESRRVLMLLFVQMGLFAFDGTELRGFVALCKEHRLRLFNKFSLHTVHSRPFAMKGRGTEKRYRMVAGDRSDIIHSAAFLMEAFQDTAPARDTTDQKGVTHVTIQLADFAKTLRSKSKRAAPEPLPAASL